MNLCSRKVAVLELNSLCKRLVKIALYFKSCSGMKLKFRNILNIIYLSFSLSFSFEVTILLEMIAISFITISL